MSSVLVANAAVGSLSGTPVNGTYQFINTVERDYQWQESILNK